MKSKYLITYFASLAILFTQSLQAQNNQYQVSINLNKVVDDKLQVSINTPTVSEDSIEYIIPKIVPGTYSIYDFGRFSSAFEAKDRDGNLLSVDSISPNRRLIKNAKTLAEISYWVEDTYDTKKDNFVFEPGGTNIEEGKNFMMNTYGFIGYLDGMKNLPYELNISHPEKMFGATALDKSTVSDTVDSYSAPNYFDLADGPIMYSEPDTTTINVGGADILISVYSPKKQLTSQFVAEQVEETLLAQKAYLGGTLPVKKYAFLIYLFDGLSGSGGMGALEHSYSSLYCLPDIPPKYLTQVIKDVAAHEFFHIVTPLNIHSEEIGDFDFINPKMSKHLWLYEGVTEYAAGLAQVKYGSLPTEKHLSNLMGKITAASKYKDDLPFTEMSKGCLDEYKPQYGNVYQKGALIGLVLDIKLRDLSDGKYGIQNLMSDLSMEYGKTKSFKDDELFDKITTLTYPEIRDFFTDYVEGSQTIPYKEIFAKVGVDYKPATSYKELTLGKIDFTINDKTNRLVLKGINPMNKFAKRMGYKKGDEILKFDGVKINIDNFESEFSTFKDRHKVGDKIKVIVLRTLENGKTKKLKLSAEAVETKIKSKQSITLMDNASEVQLALRKAWIGE